MARKRFDPVELAALKNKHRLSDLFTRYNHKVRGGMCLCPAHLEKTPSCKIDDKAGKFHCFGCGAHGDHIDFLMLKTGRSWLECIEYLGGVIELSPADRDMYAKQQERYDNEEKTRRKQKVSEAQALFDSGDDIKGTLAASYLRSRGLAPTPHVSADLRFVPSLIYHGYEKPDDNRTKELGRFPAMLAAIRIPASREIIGCHRTYLQPDGSAKLKPPGDAGRNKAKKIVGEFLGGIIHLSPPAVRLMVGEGIETTLSGDEMEIAGTSDVALAAAVNIWNMSGGALGTVQHPKFRNDAARTVPDGEPDPDRPGFLPPPWCRELILLGDGDSEPVWTRAMLATGARRYEELGVATMVAMAPTGQDWNDVLKQERGEA